MRTQGAYCALLTLLLTLAAAGAIEDVSLQVTVIKEPAAMQTPTYAALVSPMRPWREPAAECTSTAETITLRATPGEYRLLVGSDGYQTMIHDVHVGANERNAVTVTLTADSIVRAAILDEAGNPIPRATCTHIAPLLPSTIGKQSELARKTLNTSATIPATSEGQLILRLPTDRLTPLYCGAPGFAGVLVLANRSDPFDVLLQRGGRIRLSLDRDDEEFIVELSRQDSKLVSENWQPRVWSRPAARDILFDSLEPGEYRITGYEPDPHRFSPRTSLGTVTVTSGETTNLAISLPTPRPPREEYTTLFLRGRNAIDATGLHAYAATEGKVAIPYAIQQVAGGTTLFLATSATTTSWLESATTIIARQPQNKQGRSDIGIVLPRGEASTRFTADGNTPVPQDATAHFERCGPRHDTTLEIPIRINAQGEAHLAGPARCESLRFSFDDYGPVILRATLQPNEDTWLGAFQLHARASLEVQLMKRTGGSTPKTAAVSVQEASPTNGSAPAIFASGNATEDGSVVFPNVPAGIPLRISAHDQDGSQAVSTPIELQPGEHRWLSVTLPPPTTLKVITMLAMNLPAELANSQILQLRLTKEGAEQPPEQRSATPNKDHLAIFDSLAPGRWRAVALVAVAGLTYPIELEPIDVADGTPTTVTREVEPLIFEGKVIARGRGISAKVALRHEKGRIRQYVDSGPNGDFWVILPTRGQYYAELSLPADQAYRMPIGRVLFDEPLRQVTLAVPTGHATVNLRANGRAGASIIVAARPESEDLVRAGSGDLQRATDASGTARFEGLADGPWSIEARDASTGQTVTKSVNIHSSKPITIDLDL